MKSLDFQPSDAVVSEKIQWRDFCICWEMTNLPITSPGSVIGNHVQSLGFLLNSTSNPSHSLLGWCQKSPGSELESLTRKWWAFPAQPWCYQWRPSRVPELPFSSNSNEDPCPHNLCVFKDQVENLHFYLHLAERRQYLINPTKTVTNETCQNRRLK